MIPIRLEINPNPMKNDICSCYKCHLLKCVCSWLYSSVIHSNGSHLHILHIEICVQFDLEIDAMFRRGLPQSDFYFRLFPYVSERQFNEKMVCKRVAKILQMFLFKLISWINPTLISSSVRLCTHRNQISNRMECNKKIKQEELLYVFRLKESM